MAYDEMLAARVRDVLSEREGLSLLERKMFGGLAFMVEGHMACGIIGSELMVRVGTERYDEALAQAHSRPMDFTGKPMKGMIYVAPAGLKTEASLTGWVERGLAFALEQPPKGAPAKKAAKKAPAKKAAKKAPARKAPAKKAPAKKAPAKKAAKKA